jgi:RimJ/RimL family protein N-acetyltransferase
MPTRGHGYYRSPMDDEKKPMRAVYLTGKRVYLRATLVADRDHAMAWLDSPFPVSPARAESVLKDDAKPNTRTSRFVIVRSDGDEIVGAVKLRSRDGQRTAWAWLQMAPWLADRDELAGDALGLLVPWLRDQVELMVVRVPLAADETGTIAAAEALGMVQSARLREFVGRPGGRVDQLIYEALNPRWEVHDA